MLDFSKEFMMQSFLIGRLFFFRKRLLGVGWLGGNGT